MACSASQNCRDMSSLAKLAYCGLFGLSLIISWALTGELGAPLLKAISSFSRFSTTLHSTEWLHTQVVLRVSLGNFLFFTIIALVTIGVKDQNDRRDSWHHDGWLWLAKPLIWIFLMVLMFFVPSVVISTYETLSKFGVGLFLLIQAIILLDVTRPWKDVWLFKDQKWYHIAVIAASLVCYLAVDNALLFLYLLFTVFGHHCGRNSFVVISTGIFSLVFMNLLHPKLKGSFLSAAVMSLYCAYLCYLGLLSEPQDYECNGLRNKSEALSLSTLVIGLLTTVVSVVYSAVRAGSLTITLLSLHSSAGAGDLPPWKSEDVEKGTEEDTYEKEANSVSYSYTFFHLIVALASMYSATLLSDWISSSYDSSKSTDAGWTSFWVLFSTQCLTAGLYIWSLFSPSLLTGRLSS